MPDWQSEIECLSIGTRSIYLKFHNFSTQCYERCIAVDKELSDDVKRYDIVVK